MKLFNRGTGAGGANTNLFGKRFEEKTSNRARLLADGYTIHSIAEKKEQMKNNVFLSKRFGDKTVVFVEQHALRVYIKHKYNRDVYRNPDEAYILEYDNGRKVIKILEKKEQNVEGSVDTKLWCALGFIECYTIELHDFEVQYAFCVSNFLQKQIEANQGKYKAFNVSLRNHRVPILYGDDDNYFERLDAWIYADGGGVGAATATSSVRSFFKGGGVSVSGTTNTTATTTTT
jgi:hypothetical protein